MTIDPTPAADDGPLIDRTRQGDPGALAELWRRHAEAGRRYARRVTSSFDADDLVAESFVTILTTLRNGRGPSAEFRPYLFVTIRNLARRWGRARQEVPLDVMEDLEAEDSDVSDIVLHDIDASATVRAFRSLPHRWQRVLWLLEIEHLSIAEVAMLMGLSPNSVSSLAFRAREGLREAWVQAHVSDRACPGDCAWARAHLGALARHHVSARDQHRLDVHLAGCGECRMITQQTLEEASPLIAAT